MISFPFFPARPMNGGQLEHAVPKPGTWYAEAKINGWRALVHRPTGTMFNRHGEQLSIAGDFERALRELRETPFRHIDEWEPPQGSTDWCDCEAFSRRHNVGKGTLILLDLPCVELPYETRGELMRSTFFPLIGGIHKEKVFSLPCYTDAKTHYEYLQEENRILGAEVYEGIVLKKAGSLYPRQKFSPERETPYWVKHRWKF